MHEVKIYIKDSRGIGLFHDNMRVPDLLEESLRHNQESSVVIIRNLTRTVFGFCFQFGRRNRPGIGQELAHIPTGGYSLRFGKRVEDFGGGKFLVFILSVHCDLSFVMFR
jgi:hypothetical protein